jgi:hypothetical protein
MSDPPGSADDEPVPHVARRRSVRIYIRAVTESEFK